MFRIIERYEETGLGLPYPVTLMNAAEELLDDETGERLGIRVPNLEALAAAVALVRCLHPLQLAGQEVRFIRRTLGLTQRELAEQLEIEATETISRWENGPAGTAGGYTEKLLRSVAVIQLKGRVPGVDAGPEHIPALRIHQRPDGVWPKLVASAVRLGKVAAEQPVTYTMPLATLAA